MVEHYLGRASATKQVRGVFPTLSGAPEINVGRAIRNAENRITGTAAQAASTVSVHGTFPTASIPIDARAEDMILPLMSFFHNRKYTVVTPGAGSPTFTTPWTEVGTYQFGMLDAKPDHIGAVMGVYDDGAATYNEQVEMADVYSIGLEYLYGHGDLGDADNAAFIENFVANMLRFEVQRGMENYLNFTFSGFGRSGDEVEDIVEAAWGPGINGNFSDQPVLTPEDMTLTTLELNSGDVSSTYGPFLDSLTIEMVNGISGRDALGYDENNALATAGRPSVTGTIGMAHVGSDFLDALVGGLKFEIEVVFSGGTNQDLTIKLPYCKLHESFNPTSGDVGADVTLEVPFRAVIDPTVVAPLVEVQLDTVFDTRTNSFFRATTLALASTYTA
jgi:hypothetical protein